MKNKVLMVAYTNYSTDPRVIREAESLVKDGYDVEFLALKRKSDPEEEVINGVKVIHLNQTRYRGSSNFFYAFAYIQFFLGYFYFY